MKSVLITGVSTGIGNNASRYFLEQGWRVFGTVRSPADASDLEDLAPNMFVRIIMDVTDYGQVDAAARQVASVLNGDVLDLLVNNAGIVVFGPLMYVPMADFEHQINVNVLGVVKVTQAFLPLMGARRNFVGQPGKIVNIGSVSGVFSTPFLGPYCASKYALEAITDCLRRELSLLSIDVILLQPGSVISAVWDKARNTNTYSKGTVFADFLARRDYIIDRALSSAMDPMVVTRMIWKIAQGKARRPRYLITKSNFLHWLTAHLPDRWVDFFLRWRMKKFQLQA